MDQPKNKDQVKIIKDHRQIGQEQDLFVVSDLVGGGLPLFTPKGTIIRKAIHDFIQKLQDKLGYQEVWIPHMAKPELYKKSGHFEKYPERFQVTSAAGDEFILKPMNCPHHMEIFKSRTRSYRDLPIAYSEFTTNYRDEQTGELNGLLRVRSLTMDDCHIFCTEDQILDEAKKVYQTIVDFYKVFNFEIKVRLSLSDPKNKNKYIGDDAMWKKSENMIREIAKEIKLENYEGIGEAAFYGPKVDFMIKDTLNREWQLATIQLDYVIPGRLGLEYVDSNGEKKVPVAIHRAIAGSIERFTGILLEQYQGSLPLWLSPTQIVIMPITDKHEAHTKKIVEDLRKEGVRAELDNRPERLQAKIRDNSLQKIPYLGIIGDREIENSNISVRLRNGKDLGTLKISDLIKRLKEEIDKKIQ
jgi:threonyl-tRNA synthetase